MRRKASCPVCGESVRLVRSYSERHRVDQATPTTHDGVRIVIGAHDSPDNETGCVGRWMRPSDDDKYARAAARRQTKARVRCAAFREHALVALDAALAGKPYPALDLDILVRVAVYWYRTYYPDASDAAAVRYVARLSRAKTATRFGDTYCTFCGELRLRNLDYWGASLSDTPRNNLHALAMRDSHVITCALYRLAHDIKPAAPDVRKLPDEYLPEREEAAP